ncbi:SDR family NAD(P)-dependent oxidoreductase [Altererythrobacter aurantiacus]|uniref:SDR family NAD(P)-dependent oxidoreductase n=1 Tax=Parapontixanthobacter aurantiacus TaxID=1463599 RepID=A0A844ZEP8_9SPHN|nr:SDR family NAD(P)-dependent oxidoreductase [Parapontixanthobacter aurantiacus]MXO85440.1 SDR family NAD(P)-dependent oxidoreductase [Parapontixanthobacter aurantiacus]
MADPPLAGKTALVTGSSKGIGAATAQALAEAGAHVILTGRDVRSLEKVEDRIHESGGSSSIAPLDLTEKNGVARLSSAIAQRWDRLDILVISAAYLPTLSSVVQIDGAEFAKAMSINVLATHALLAGFDSLLKRAPNARVIGLTSSVGASPRPFWGAYGSSKAAFDNLLESYAGEVERISAIRVAIVDPGATRTQMRAKAYPGEDPKTVKQPSVVADRIVALLTNDFSDFHRERVEE